MSTRTGYIAVMIVALLVGFVRLACAANETTQSPGHDVRMPTAAECRRMGQVACEEQRVRAQRGAAERNAAPPNAASVPPNGSDTAPGARQPGPAGTEAHLPSAAECRSMGQAACEALRVRLQQETQRRSTTTAAPPGAPNPVPPSDGVQQVESSERSPGQEVPPSAPGPAPPPAIPPTIDQTPQPPPTGVQPPVSSSNPMPDNGSSSPPVSTDESSRSAGTGAPVGPPEPVNTKTDAPSRDKTEPDHRSRLLPKVLMGAAATGLLICLALLVRRWRKSADYKVEDRPRRFGPPVLDGTEDDVRESPEPLVAILESDAGVAYPVQRPITHIGRSTENDIIISDPTVSRLHAIMRRQSSGGYSIENRSDNGTFVNDESIELIDLAEGDLITIGTVRLRYLPVET